MRRISPEEYLEFEREVNRVYREELEKKKKRRLAGKQKQCSSLHKKAGPYKKGYNIKNNSKHGKSAEMPKRGYKCSLLPQMPGYSTALQALRALVKPYDPHPLFVTDAGKEIARPLTFRELHEKRIEDFETLYDSRGNKRTLENRMQLFNETLASSTGIAYKVGTSKFKIIPVCRELIILPSGFKNKSLCVDYDSLRGYDLESAWGTYNSQLTKLEVLNHPGWLASFECDRRLLNAYCDIVFNKKINSSIGKPYLSVNRMAFFLRNITAADELYPLNSDSMSNAFGEYFNFQCKFLRMCPD